MYKNYYFFKFNKLKKIVSESRKGEYPKECDVEEFKSGKQSGRKKVGRYPLCSGEVNQVSLSILNPFLLFKIAQKL